MHYIACLFVLLATCSGVSAKHYTSAEIDAMFVRRPLPEYPVDLRRRHITGTGVFRLSVDEHGRVTDVTTVESTKNAQLDASAIRAFRHWRAKPGSRREVDVPATFWFPNHPKW
jgi:TonB family protein